MATLFIQKAVSFQGKGVKSNPREVATKIVAEISDNDVIDVGCKILSSLLELLDPSIVLIRLSPFLLVLRPLMASLCQSKTAFLAWPKSLEI